MKRPTKFWVRKVDSVNIIDITGRLAPESGPDELYHRVSELLNAGEKNFLIDLSGTTFVSSLGLGSLLRAMREIEAKEGKLKLLSPSHSVARILEISRMSDVFEILKDEQSAVASFALVEPAAEPAPKKAARGRKKKTTETED